jgi:hypothetical protein
MWPNGEHEQRCPSLARLRRRKKEEESGSDKLSTSTQPIGKTEGTISQGSWSAAAQQTGPPRRFPRRPGPSATFWGRTWRKGTNPCTGKRDEGRSAANGAEPSVAQEGDAALRGQGVAARHHVRHIADRPMTDCGPLRQILRRT